MIVQKAGTILLNLNSKQIGLVYRETDKKYSFPKGHLEKGETLKQCAIRETEEETLRRNHLLINEEIYILKYTTPSGENIECYYYISVDDGPTLKNIALKFKSFTIFLIIKSCWASFWPKYAFVQPVILKSLDTTVATPSKCPGLLFPQSLFMAEYGGQTRVSSFVS